MKKMYTLPELENMLTCRGEEENRLYSEAKRVKNENIGNNVYATGDATVQSTDLGQPRRGYGKQILLNHQYGYQTRYAHLSQIFVKPGEKVVRGQLIGKVGNTGGVTGPHLHYEVIHMGQVVNPINYFNRNMTNEEYERLMEQMQELNLDTFDE